MPPILWKIDEPKRALGNRGVGPNLDGFNPIPGQYLTIFGITKDSSGVALGSCTVHLFRTADDVLIEQKVSDASGNYEFRGVSPSFAFYVVAYKAGSPDVAGTTVNTLLGTLSSGVIAAATYRALTLSLGATAYFRLGEASGNAVDEVASITASSMTGITYGRPGALLNDANTAMGFTSGAGSQISIPSNAAWLMANGAMSLVGWVKRSVVTSGSPAMVDSGSTGGLGYVAFFDSIDRLRFADSAVIQDIAHSSTTITDTTNWHMWAVTRPAASSGGTKLYLDAVDVTILGTDETLTDSSNNMHIGSAFNGDQDEVTYFKGIQLTAANIVALYHAAGY